MKSPDFHANLADDDAATEQGEVGSLASRGYNDRASRKDWEKSEEGLKLLGSPV